LPEAIAQFQQRFPAIALSIAEYYDCPAVEEDLRKGRVDVGFISTPVSDEFETWELLQDEYVALFPPSFRRTDRLSWEQLTTYPLIMAPVGDSCDEQVHNHCLKFGISLSVAYHVSSDSTLVSMVAQGLGATIVPRLAADPIPASVQVYSLPIPLFRVIRIAILADALLVPAVFAFVEMLKTFDLSRLAISAYD
jgi:DNA-binding transcriptional LysR family regulator